MIQIKKTLLTLVALLAVTTGAWADDAYEEFTTADESMTQLEFTGEHIKITGTDIDIDGLEILSDYPVTISALNGKVITKVELTVSAIDYWDNTYVITSTPNATIEGTYAVGQKFTITPTGANPSEITLSANIDMTVAYIQAKNWKVYYADAPAATGPTVAWTAAENTGTFTMPGGNVTLEPEYYTQAALAAQPTAINDVPATTDGAIVKAGTVATIGETTTAQGTVMYYVSPSALDDAALLALAADQWTADVPTAKSLAEGQAYVYYYVRGNDGDNDDETFSDGDILATNALTVTIAAEPTYAVTFAEGTDPNEWTAEPAADVKKGTAVTVTYTGTRKVIGVKAEKKAAASTPSLNITNPAVGQVIGSDGKNYAYASLPTGVTAVAKICYVSGSNGLALALTDEGKMDWSTAKTTCAAHTAPFTGGTWKLASEDEWTNMINAAGNYSTLRDGFSSVGGTNMQANQYWSSTEPDTEGARVCYFNDGYWTNGFKGEELYVRACLAF